MYHGGPGVGGPGSMGGAGPGPVYGQVTRPRKAFRSHVLLTLLLTPCSIFTSFYTHFQSHPLTQPLAHIVSHTWPLSSLISIAGIWSCWRSQPQWPSTTISSLTYPNTHPNTHPYTHPHTHMALVLTHLYRRHQVLQEVTTTVAIHYLVKTPS